MKDGSRFRADDGKGAGEFPVVLYSSPDGRVVVNALVQDETLWLTQAGMAELFEVDKSSINRNLKNIFAEGELAEEVVVAKIATTTLHGAIDGKVQSHLVSYYNLDAITAVGYRVNSVRATRFRIWATGVLREYIGKGFALNDDKFHYAITEKTVRCTMSHLNVMNRGAATFLGRRCRSA